MTLGWFRSLTIIDSTSRSHHSGKVEGVVECGLVLGPHVEGLVHDEHAEAVAGVEHRLAERVVRAADCVEAGSFQQFDAAFFGTADRSSS